MAAYYALCISHCVSVYSLRIPSSPIFLPCNGRRTKQAFSVGNFSCLMFPSSPQIVRLERKRLQEYKKAHNGGYTGLVVYCTHGCQYKCIAFHWYSQMWICLLSCNLFLSNLMDAQRGGKEKRGKKRKITGQTEDNEY